MNRAGVLALMIGMLLGASLVRIGFTDYDEVQAMFTLADLRMIWVFAGAVLASAMIFRMLPAASEIPPRPIGRPVVVGGLLFGVGWALSGACPGAAFAQLGEGRIWALASIGGVVLGTLLWRPLNLRVLGWDRQSCN